MIKNAWGFPEIAYSNLDPVIARFENHTMMPLYTIPDINKFVFAERRLADITYTDVLYGIIRMMVADPDKCLDKNQVAKITQTTLPHVQNITNYMYSLQRNLEATYDTILAVRHHNITNQCYEKIIRNGIPVSRDLHNLMCPVCTDETASTRTCHSTCINTVRGCYADVTTIIPLYEELLKVMDEQHLKLKYMMISRRGDLAKVIFYIKQVMSTDTLDCVRDNPFSSGRRDSFNYLNKHPKMYSANKGLSGIFNSPDLYPCSLSRTTTTLCWTGTRSTPTYDSGFARPFTEPEQLQNPEVSYQRDTSPYILEVRTTLQNAMEMSKDAENGVLLLPVRSQNKFDFSSNKHPDTVKVHFVMFCMTLVLFFAT